MKNDLKIVCTHCTLHTSCTQMPLIINDFLQKITLHTNVCRKSLHTKIQHKFNYLPIIITTLQCPIVYTIGGVKPPPMCAQTSFLFQTVKRVVGDHRIIDGGAI